MSLFDNFRVVQLQKRDFLHMYVCIICVCVCECVQLISVFFCMHAYLKYHRMFLEFRRKNLQGE